MTQNTLRKYKYNSKQYNLYKDMHENQTLDFVKEKYEKYSKLNNAKLSIKSVLQLMNNFIEPYEKNLVNQVRRQDIPQAYYYTGVIYISKISAFKKYRGFNHSKTLAYVVPKWKAPEIDDIYDFIFIEALLKNKKHLLIGE